MPGARAEAPGEPADPQQRPGPELQRRRARRERRRERDGAVDGTGARVRGERDRVRRHARLHDRRRRRAGGRSASARTRRERTTRRSPFRPGSTTTSSATLTAATAASTARRFASTPRVPKILRRGRWRSSPRGSRRGLRAVAPDSPDGAARSVQPRRRPQRAQRPGVRRRSGSARRARTTRSSTAPTTRSTAWTFTISGRTPGSTPPAMATLALAPPPPVVVTPRGVPTIDRRPSGYDAHLRWAGVTWRGGLSDLLAQRVGARLGARDRGRKRDGVHAAEGEHRRLGLRRGRGGCRRSREHGQRLCGGARTDG